MYLNHKLRTLTIVYFKPYTLHISYNIKTFTSYDKEEMINPITLVLSLFTLESERQRRNATIS